ncbi:MAG: hypothetical protein R2710_23475 [Acidimicrobiales bacterium]
MRGCHHLVRPAHLLLDPAGVEGPERIGTDDVNRTALLGGSAGPVAIDGALLLPGIRGGTITIDRYDLATDRPPSLRPYAWRERSRPRPMVGFSRHGLDAHPAGRGVGLQRDGRRRARFGGPRPQPRPR